MGTPLTNNSQHAGSSGTASDSQNGRKPVIADVARLAGVSVPTVSRVLTGHIPVSEERRQRVLDAIEQLQYRPSSLARALKSGERRMIAILTSSTELYGYMRTIAGVERAAQEVGYSVVISTVKSANPDDAAAALAPVLEQQVAGAIVIDFDQAGAEFLRQLPDHLPAVAASGFSQGLHR
jgi:DNA-binding LacI/PurR family transcriptional regulator